jgi:Cu/Ag efflux protein CusF
MRRRIVKRSYIAAGLSLLISAASAYGQDGRAAVNGVVTEVDQRAGTVTLDHDEVPNLQMAAMLMAWTVKDRAMLKGLKPGDKVKFKAEDVDGEPKVVEIEKVK